MNALENNPNGKPEWVGVLNTHVDDIPAFGVMLVVGVDASESGRGFKVSRPTSGSVDRIMTGDSSQIPSNTHDYPLGQATFHRRVVVAYDEADGVPELGEEWGPAADSWLLHAGGTGFVCLDDDAKDGIANWHRKVNEKWPPGYSICCPSTTPTSQTFLCPDEGSSGTLGTYYSDCCGAGGVFPWGPEVLQEIGGYLGIDTIYVGCGWDEASGLVELQDFCNGETGTQYVAPMPRVLCISILDGTGSFADVTDIVGIESAYNFAGSWGSGWPLNYYDPDTGFRINGVMRACPDREKGFYFVGQVYVMAANEGEGGAEGSGSFPCGCLTKFPACPPESDTPPSQEVLFFGPAEPRMITRIHTPCGSFTIRMGQCESDVPGYTYCCGIPFNVKIVLAIADGPNAGTYVIASTGPLEFTAFGGLSIALQCSDGIYSLVSRTETVTSVSVACEPFAVAFGAGFGSTGSTLTLQA
jgi:hypothetical protein